MGKRPVLTPDEVLRLPIDEALVIIRGKKILKVDKLDYSEHPDYPRLRSCKASAYIPEWRKLEEEKAVQRSKGREPNPKEAKAGKKAVKSKASVERSPKRETSGVDAPTQMETAANNSTNEEKKGASPKAGRAGIVAADKEAIMS